MQNVVKELVLMVMLTMMATVVMTMMMVVVSLAACAACLLYFKLTKAATAPTFALISGHTNFMNLF